MFKKIKKYIKNRFILKKHALTSHTLKKGVWHELDTRMLHCLFDELVNFVESETAEIHCLWDEDKAKKYNYKNSFFNLRPFRSKEAGLEHLNWASKLIYEKGHGFAKEDLGKPTEQALAAIDILELYKWWTEKRPKREDPYESSGWSRNFNFIENKYGSYFGSKRTKEEDKKTSELLIKLTEIESAYDKEDEDMLIRLIKIRKHLWT